MNRTTAKFEIPPPRQLFLRVLVVVFLAELVVHFFLFRVEKLVPGGFPQELLDSATLSLILAPFLWWWIVRPLGSAATRERMLAANIINTSEDAIITIDDRGRVTAFNPAAERLFSYAEEEVIGQNVKMLMPPTEREQHDAHIGRYLRTGEKKVIGIRRELVARRKDGATFPIYLSLSELREGDRLIFTAIVQDLTDRKRAEEALQKSERHFRSLIENALDLVWVINANGTVRYQSPSTETVLDYLADELVGRDVFELVHPEDLAKVQEVLASTLQNPGAPYFVECRVHHRNGSWRVVEGLCKYVVANLESPGLVINARDITERKQVENNLAKERTLLQETLAEVKTLRGILPICASCKRIRNSSGEWTDVAAYISGHTDAEFSHGMCPSCTERLYPDIYRRMALKKR